MVIEDFTKPPGASPTAKQTDPAGRMAHPPRAPMAAPIDRLAAVVADLVLLVPMISLLTAPFRRRWELARLLRDNDMLVSSFAGLGFCAIVAVVLYQTFFICYWGATPGKRLLGLRVVSFWDGEIPLPMNALMRSLFWCLECILFFMPWLGVMSNERRRPWHDRIADTEVIALEPRHAVGPPDSRELALVSGIHAATLCTMAAISAFTLVRIAREGMGGSTGRLAATEDNGFLCSIVTEAQEEWLSIEGEPASRVDVAIALFGADAVGESCLESEADYALWNGEASASAYMAKALVVSNDSESYAAYTRKTCQTEPASAACRLAQLVVEDDDKKGLKKLSSDEVLKTIDPQAPAFLHIYLVRELMNDLRFADALKLIDRGAAHRRLGYFYASHRSQALWGLHRRVEARVAFRSSLEGLDTSQRTRLVQWFCDVESGDACSQEAAQSCGLLERAVEKSPIELEDVGTALAWIRGQECSIGAKVDYVKMRDKVPGASTQAFIGALEQLQKNDKASARKGFEKILSEAEETNPVWFEAQSRLVEIADNETDLSSLLEKWQKSEAGVGGWLRVGRLLIKKFEVLGLNRRSLEVGQKMLAWDPFDSNLKRHMVVWAYKTGDVRTAAQLLKGLSSTADRSPASIDADFDHIAREVATTVLPSTAVSPITSPTGVRAPTSKETRAP